MYAPRIVRALVVATALAAAALAQRIPESEPNDTPATANLAPMGAQMDAALTPGDFDWFEFSIAGTSSVKLFTSPLSATSVDTVLTLFDNTGVTVLAENDDQRGVHSDVTIELLAGTYRVRVRGFSAGITGAYSLDLAATAPVGFTGTEAPEPNDSTATATPVGCGGEIDGELTNANDSDWYRVVVSSPRIGIVFSVLGGAVPQLASFNWEVRDSAGILLTPTTTLGVNFGINAKVNAFQLRRCWPQPLPPNTYYFCVSANGSSTGKYRLECAVMPMDSGVVRNEGAGPTAINPGDWGIGTLSAIGQADVWGPITISPGYLMAQLSGDATSMTPVSAARVELLDKKQQSFTNAFGEPLGAVVGGNTLDPGSHARGTWRLDGTGDNVYLRVTAPSGNIGGYRLEVGQCGPFFGPTWFGGSGKKEGLDNVTCLGSNGQRPWLTTDSIYEVPVLGSTFCRKVLLAPPSSFAFLIQGFSDETGIVGPLPLDLSFLGAPGCQLLVDPLVLTLAFTDGTGRAEFVQTTPNSLSLSGAMVFEQVGTFDPPANALGIAFSNSLQQILGSLSY